jgi:hypothetical protein
MSSRTAAVVALLLAPALAGAEQTLPPLTPDQVIVAAAAVEDTFPRPRHPTAPTVLCLDVRLSDDAVEAASPPPRETKRKKGRASEPPAPVFRGAPPELLARLARPWRRVASADSCRLNPRQPYTLDDARTPARLVTIRLGASVAQGSLRIDWAGGTEGPPGLVSSRDCSATHDRRGWNVRCGGTWTE